MVLKKNFHQKDCLLEHVYKRIQTTADKNSFHRYMPYNKKQV